MLGGKSESRITEGILIYIAQPNIGQEEIDAVNKVLKSGMLAQGPVVAEFEEAFAQYCGVKHALAVNSGTAALHAALAAAGVGPGDQVITTPFSFIATINPILMQGAEPVLVDIDPKTFNIDPAKIAKAITPKTKAIIPVDLYGQPCEWDAINKIAADSGLVVIEDACQAVGAEYKGKKAGSLGDMGCFSLYATKNIMSGEGGVITTDSDEYAAKIRSFRQHGMTGPYEYESLGYNYRMMDLQAAIAKEQLKKADNFNRARVENARKLSAGLRKVSGIKIPYLADGRTHVYHQYTIRVEKDFPITRIELQEFLKERGIVVGVYYPKPLDSYPHIKRRLGLNRGFPNSNDAASAVLSLPVHPMLSDEDVAQIISAMKEAANA
jgi:dTDP-4-amino-4,6-dideoxygalactose transaminase